MWTVDFDHWIIEIIWHFRGHKSEVWMKPLVDQIPKMQKEFVYKGEE
jgi:hypothetical protein